MLKRLGLGLVIVTFLVVALFWGTRHFIQPINTDLSVIGQGKPVLVLAYENFSPDSGAVLNQLNRIKGDYEQYLRFVVADLGTPQGQQFALKHNLVNGAAVFISADGQAIATSMLSKEEQFLRKLLDDNLVAVGINR